MAKGAKQIQRRIKSINNTRKITRAMEMVAAAKMKKESSRVLAIRAYAKMAQQVLFNLSRAFGKYHHGLLETREVKNILVVLITSNRGLCGAYNAQILKKTMAQINNPKSLKINRFGNQQIESNIPDEELTFDFIAVGKKGFDFLKTRKKNIIAEFSDLNYAPTFEAIFPLARVLIDDYKKKQYDKVVVAYTDYKNSLIQEPKLRQLLPISKVDLEKQIEEMGLEKNKTEKDNKEMKIIDYKIEPKPKEVLRELLPRLVEMQLYHSILESNASRESARMVAMKNANEAAGEMMDHLQYSYNQIRQMSITQEIAEISSGRAALED